MDPKYKSTHRSFIKGKNFKQASFYVDVRNYRHHGRSDREVTLIDQKDSADALRRRKSFWQHELDTYQLNGLNESDVALF